MNRTILIKSLSVIIIGCLFWGPHVAAQDIVFCSNYTPKGEAIGVSNTWNLDEKGRYVYILFSNYNKVIKSKNLILNIRKKTSAGYQNYEKRAMEIQNGGRWALLDYQFTEAGDYEAIVLDKKDKELATSNIIITLKAPAQNNGQNQIAEKDPDREYYSARTIFCRSITNGMALDTGSLFRVGELLVAIVNQKPLATDTMIVDIFKKGYHTEKYPIYVTSKNFWIDGAQTTASFSIDLDETGEYKVITYNRRSQTISEGYVTIR